MLWKRSCRNVPARTRSSRLRCVATTTRASTRTVPDPLHFALLKHTQQSLQVHHTLNHLRVIPSAKTCACATLAQPGTGAQKDALDKFPAWVGVTGARPARLRRLGNKLHLSRRAVGGKVHCDTLLNPGVDFPHRLSVNLFAEKPER